MNQRGRVVARGIDFAKLYAELGVAPDCGLDAFRQAYRRRVAGLHPDRPGTGPHDPDALIALNLGYAAARDFHRGQGRLPGAPAASGSRRAPAGSARPDTPPWPAAVAQARRRASRMRVLALPVLLLAATWFWLPGVEPAVPAGDQPAVADPQSIAPALARAQLGMDRSAVAALIGEPVARDADDSRWIYGPSWLRFECGRLADWYSSPLRPLPVGPRAPQARNPTGRASRRVACPPPAGKGPHHTHGSS